MISVEHLTFQYPNSSKPVLQDLSVGIKDGVVTTLMGANGCGKTTLLQLLTKNLKPDHGTIKMNGTDILGISLREYARQAAIVHQKNTAPEDLAVEHLVSYGRLPYSSIFKAGLDAENQQQVERALALTNLTELRHRPIGTLSGGQRQRAFIAMALAQNTKVLFLDEPTTFLDVRYQVEILRLVERLNREEGIMDQTLAAGERVLALLEEHPETEEILEGTTPVYSGAAVKNLSFSYGKEEILHDLTASFPQGEIVAVTGKSGSGKSTLLKLLMRFWKVREGSVSISGQDVGQIQTAHLRNLESYMIQDTDLFHDSIAENIRIGKQNATQAEIEEAAKKAAIHDFILTLPKGYDTPVGELGDTLSGGERQRIGLARAFLHDAPLMLLDEPTSNLDSLNEGVILQALEKNRGMKTVILVSHRSSTLSIADRAYIVENGRLC